MLNVWMKSSLCRTDTPMCVEVQMITAPPAGENVLAVDVRDSKDPKTVLSFLPEEWTSFIEGVKRGDFDIT